ncbi:hypothetical protein S7335_3112 [Synechococcus sp. PCC 7335]|uniref:hormogonium polysaccharide biosynthesis protein HpsA n=1 Tax=Synechococcus sp. (strain ATCC 29403 / PCC 7335) TaxID=91464 RepID=UPI00017ECE25|nr:hormogonium polysaccharide biosynthesis protein HpsA [Synechococcus sp. PCC 7335]EDX85411.1 hypothetical protein S7335_3112 [Synechococcus sp. PCC 7335]
MSAKKQTRNRTRPLHSSDFQRLSRRFMSGFLRSLFLFNKSARYSRAGFVLPTTVLLLLIMTLTVGALSYRTASRTQSAYLTREQQVIDNVATPAIDRAKAKLEYLFGRDTRFPSSSTPSSDLLVALMANVTDSSLGVTALVDDPYELPGEERIDINGDDTVDNAWMFTFDLNGDGIEDQNEIVAYSILMDDAVDVNSTPNDREDDIKIEDVLSPAKANALVTRNGPLNAEQAPETCGGSRVANQGWYQVSSALLEKNFQVTAYVSNGKDLGRANSALELQQVRRASKGNRWGAWFKYDLEIFPGPEFNLNGAMHTDGNLMVDGRARLHMVSSHNSCLYTQDASAITLAEVDNDGDGIVEPTSGDFEGQLIVGNSTSNRIRRRNNPRIHIYDGVGNSPLTRGEDANLTVNTDSVDAGRNVSPLNIALNPLALFTRNVSEHRNTDTWTRDPDWERRKFFTRGRITNENQNPPYLDDFYRADNRYGPRPSYSDVNWVNDTDDGTITTTRTSPSYDKKLGETILASDPNGENLIDETSGLDGYWERQAGVHGLRLVVGQRLELGNHYGWQSNSDPLYPPNSTTISNLQRQRRTLRDNLAAVQGMVVYHYESDSGSYPLACYAATSHPGTFETLQNSRDFQEVTFKDSSNNDVSFISNFLIGKGTNGWEYDFPLQFRASGGTNDSFGAALADNKPLGIALRNLAYLAGDPKGGSPSFPPVQDSTVHPFPQMAMWGDYSMLRRIFTDFLDNKTNWKSSLSAMSDRYDALSPADKSSLHSAACTMGLLANSLTSLNQLDWDATVNAGTFSGISNQGQVMTKVGKPVWNAFGITNSGPGSGSFAEKYCKPISGVFANSVSNSGRGNGNGNGRGNGNGNGNGNGRGNGNNGGGGNGNNGGGGNGNGNNGGGGNGNGGGGGGGNKNNYDCTGANLSPEEIIARAALSPGAIEFIENLSSFTQIDRDRTYGFQGSPSSTSFSSFEVSIGNDNYTFNFPDDCHPDNAAGSIASLFSGRGNGLNDEKAGVALVCATTPKYPALHYLFPIENHDQNDDQPAAEEYIASTYIFDDRDDNSPGNDTGVNREVTYRVVGDDDLDGLEESSEQGMSAIAFDHRSANSWKLPRNDTGTSSGGGVNPETMQIVDTDGTLVDVSLLEKGMYNGREEMTVRVLDIDLGRLTQATNPDGSDYWVSDGEDSYSGIIYAAREDAAREDSIVRPAAGNWEDCDELSNIANFTRNSMSASCRMDVSSATPTDPPLTKRDDGSDVGISIKPINYATDPDRRPYGFRLNADLNNNKGDISDNKKRKKGVSFVTDNAAYIKGNFNPHSTDGDDSIEEFTQTLFVPNSRVDFYDGRTVAGRNLDKFAVASIDRWRVAEVLADAVTILSDSFVDGSIEEGFINDRDERSSNFNNSRTSFHNQQRPLRSNNRDKWAGADGWVREDSNTPHDTGAPVWVGRNGESRTADNLIEEATDNNDFVIRKNASGLNSMLIDENTPHRVNATMISGLVPSREGQSYGGLHNFPRFIQDWNTNLFIQGAFLQLNFSTASTAPFSISAWEPGEYSNSTRDIIPYYGPPERSWGYDVALQYAPAGPIAQRFVTIERPRSEHYRELPIDDPYVEGLRCAKMPDGTTLVFSDETTNCPP